MHVEAPLHWWFTQPHVDGPVPGKGQAVLQNGCSTRGSVLALQLLPQQWERSSQSAKVSQ
jgi:hypothetical protein